MALNFNPAIFWLFGGAATAGGVGYVVVEQGNLNPPAQVAALVQPEAEPEKPKIVLEEKAAEPKQEAEAETFPAPAFDLLRVEKDGSAVIAGSAVPNSLVEILDGEEIIAKTQAGSVGDFAIVLDKPLSPGPHELVIRSTREGKEPVYSQEAGIINIPEKGDDLIAMVTKPGAPSRIIQKPEAAEPIVAEVEKPAEVAKAEPEEPPKAEAESVVEVEKTEPESVKEEVKVAALPEKQEEAAHDVTEEVAPEIKEVEAEPAETVAEQPVEPETEIEAVTEPEPEVKEMAKLPEQAPEKKQVKAVRPVLIEAAEVEGQNVFIAGIGEPGTIVNLYMDGTYLGSAKIGDEGAFLYEGSGGLEPGRYAVRVDMLDKNSSGVLARAEVSLLHRPDEIAPKQVAALAKPAEEKPAVKAVVEEKKAETQEFVKLERATEPAAKDQAKLVEDKSPVQTATESAEPESAKQPEAATPAYVAKYKPAASETEVTPQVVAKREEPQAGEPKPVYTAKYKPGKEPVVAKEQPTSGFGYDNRLPEIVTGSAVIIRRGDNLWQVSRRRWGRGIRYTVIFDANRDQIRDPDLIYPGQVFKMPELAEGEEKPDAG